MAQVFPPPSLKGYRIHLVGIKGTGMTALAEILAARGALLSGSDRPERFYTDRILAELGIPVRETFSADNLDPRVGLVVHSAAYSPRENPELAAVRLRGLPLYTYPEALGLLSAQADSSGIAGTHGKTTTTALAGLLLRDLDLPATVLAGSEVADFGGRSCLVRGERYLVAETCEYRRHFLNYCPQRIIITNIEPDHLDYYRDREDLLEAFTSYGERLPPGGTLIYGADDPGAREVAGRLRGRRPDLVLIPYGERADGAYRIEAVETARGRTRFRLSGLPGELAVPMPGRHSAWNATAALALALDLRERENGDSAVDGKTAETLREALAGFRGIRRRCEILGEARGVLFMDDYGHHPTEVLRTLEGLRDFHPDRRLVVDFMSHTYSRTLALLEEFARAFEPAHEVILHDIYASAREERSADISGEILCQAIRRHHPSVRYYAAPLDALPVLAGELRPGDLFLTMGAGDNWKLGRELYKLFSEGTR